MLENLEIDAGLSYLNNEPLGRVISAPIYAESYTLVTHANHPLATQDDVDWADIAKAKLCLLTPDMQNRRIINECFATAGVVPDVAVESNSTVVLAAHVASGDWVTVLPSDMAHFLGAGKDLVIRPICGPQMPQHVGLIAPIREPRTPVLQALLAEVTAIGVI